MKIGVVYYYIAAYMHPVANHSCCSHSPTDLLAKRSLNDRAKNVPDTPQICLLTSKWVERLSNGMGLLPTLLFTPSMITYSWQFFFFYLFCSFFSSSSKHLVMNHEIPGKEFPLKELCPTHLHLPLSLSIFSEVSDFSLSQKRR